MWVACYQVTMTQNADSMCLSIYSDAFDIIIFSVQCEDWIHGLILVNFHVFSFCQNSRESRRITGHLLYTFSTFSYFFLLFKQSHMKNHYLLVWFTTAWGWEQIYIQVLKDASTLSPTLKLKLVIAIQVKIVSV